MMFAAVLGVQIACAATMFLSTDSLAQASAILSLSAASGLYAWVRKR